MAKISLRMYNREIEGLIEQQRLEEAIAHSRHILRTYPKHLETYRLLGKAYLEARRYEEAVDIFQRVLVAAPDDFVSHVGMSIISDDKGRLDDAIWHMERAFEVQPSNAAIQQELQRLFGRRDGVEPPKIRLTRGALAHMYVQGELYNQAIAEIRLVLSNDAKRTDMQTLLALAYYRNGQRAEATDTCNELLERYKYRLEANRLMAEILQGTPTPEAAQEYRQRVIELDPYAAFAQESLFQSDAVSDNVVTLERLEYTGQTGEMPPVLGIGLEPETTPLPRQGPSATAAPPAAQAGNLPAWLSGVAEEPPASKPPAQTAAAEEDIPAFLRESGWARASGPEAAPPEPPQQPEPAGGAVEGDLPDWVKALAPAEGQAPAPEPAAPSTPGFSEVQPGAASEVMPDWMQSLSSAGSLTAAPEPEAEAPALPPDAPDWLRDLGAPAAATEAAEEVPDWLKEVSGRELDDPAAPPKAEAAPPPEAVAPEPPAEETPDWLREFSNDLETPVTETPQPPQAAAPAPAAPAPTPPSAGLGTLGTSAQEQDDAMAWLESLAAKHGARPEELVTDPSARTDVAPEWVDKAMEIGEAAPSEQASAPETPTDETGVWLRNLTAEAAGSQPEPEQPAQEQPLDFRSSLGGTQAFAGIASTPGEEEAPIMGEQETPPWLRQFGTQPRDVEQAPEWLHQPSPEQEPVQSEAPAPPAPEAEQATEPAEEAADLPSWLAGLEGEQAAAVPSKPEEPSEELPAWLQSEIEPEPEAREPAKPSDWKPVQPMPPAPRRGVEERAPTTPLTPAPAPQAERPQPAATPRPRATPVPAPPASLSLRDAQNQLGRGNIAAALDIYTRLIRKGKALEDIIRDLRDALYRYPVEVPLWQSLGDAYMRANRLQEALDAYTKAEELLR